MGLLIVAATGAMFHGDGGIDLWLHSSIDTYRVPFDYPDLTVDPAERVRDILGRIERSDPANWPETIRYAT